MPQPARFAAAAESLRAAARWLLTAAAGLLVVLVAGLQITGLSGLPALRAAAALVGAAAAIGAVAYMAGRAVDVLTAEWPTLTELGAQAVSMQIRPATTRSAKVRQEMIAAVQKDIELHREELYGAVAETIPDLNRLLAEVNTELNRPGSHAVFLLAASPEGEPVGRA